MENTNNISRLLKYNIHFIKIKYKKNICYIYVNEEDFYKLKKYFNIYNISLYRMIGFTKYKYLLKKYYSFVIGIIFGIITLYLLSNVIFEINIMTNKKDLIKIINDELKENGLLKYHFVKSYEEKENIKKRILTKYKDKIEWLEINRVGSKYYINILERVIHNEENAVHYQNVIAKRNAIILEIKSSSGQIIKKVNDYVNKGDVIISGNITKNEEIKKRVRAEGRIYGETWYNVKVELPRAYDTVIRTGNKYNRFTLEILNNRFFIFGKKNYVFEEYEDKTLIDNKILPFKINKTTIFEIKNDKQIYTYNDALNKGLEIARNKLLNNIGKECKILEQKKLKLYEENSKIIIEVFFKVYEDITGYEEIMDGE